MDKITTLVLSGGAIKGHIFGGVYKYLEEVGIAKQLTCVAGTSIGAVIALFICIGYTANEILEILKYFNFQNYYSLQVDKFMENFGLETGEKIRRFLGVLFVGRHMTIDVTFEELFERTGKWLVINATCIETQETEYFSYKTHPKMKVITAINASVAIPYIFACVKYNNRTYVDGCVLDNLIVNYFDDDPLSVIGINLRSVKEILHPDITCDSLTDFTKSLISSIYYSYHVNQEKNYGDCNIIHIDAKNIISTVIDLEINIETKNKLYQLGYDQTKEYFQTVFPRKIQKIRWKKEATHDFIRHMEEVTENNDPEEMQQFLKKQLEKIKEKVKPNKQ